MVSDLFFSQLVLIALVWLCLMLYWVWPSDPAACTTNQSSHPHYHSVSVSPNPLRASPTSRTATPVSMPLTRIHTPPRIMSALGRRR